MLMEWQKNTMWHNCTYSRFWKLFSESSFKYQPCFRAPCCQGKLGILPEISSPTHPVPCLVQGILSLSKLPIFLIADLVPAPQQRQWCQQVFFGLLFSVDAVQVLRVRRRGQRAPPLRRNLLLQLQGFLQVREWECNEIWQQLYRPGDHSAW